jgi:hypothetical protein
MKVEDMQRLERVEKMMIKWMCGVTLEDGKASDELRQRLEVCWSEYAKQYAREH